MNILRLTLIILLAGLISLPLIGQDSLNTPEFSIQEVVINPKQITSEQPGFKFYNIDSAILKNYFLYSLNDLLNETTPLFIKYYGSGGAATSSFRGTSAGHTEVTWNGININDPMLGQSDFSLVPAGLADNVMISFGGAAMDLGNSGIGGVINIENAPDWEETNTVEVSPAIGSFGHYTGYARVNAGNDHFKSVTRAFLSTAKNNFSYLDAEQSPEPVWSVRENNMVRHKGFMQELYLRKSKNILSARFWYQTADRDLPGSILYGYSGEKQKDNAFRSLLNYTFFSGKSEYSVSAAWLSSDLNYLCELYSIDSRNKVNSMVLKGTMTSQLGNYTRLKIVLNEEYSLVSSNNYFEDVARNTSSLTISAERKKGRRYGAAILVRETLHDGNLLIPDFSAGFEYRLIPGKEHYAKINLSRNSKIPSLNDRYWNPGGNPGLRNEYAYSWEMGYKWDHKITQYTSAGLEAGWFKNYIRDMIQWRPSELPYWIADNIERVNTSGFESSAFLRYSANDFQVRIASDYSNVKAVSLNSETKGKQLIYVPRHQLKSSARLSFKNIYSVWITDLTGRIFTAADNSDFIRGYTLNNIAAGMKYDFPRILLDASIRMDNIFNVSYETIKYYPQPGRSFLLTMSFTFKSNP
ncbi:MAG TPA: TonB-dependent receptor plug domain-containing protein [Bacteroidales bacterium]|nr:TonB-dependent receptor [Bacteroidales bacterium]OQB65692.1 MAG: vitamin B12/cobalamin outer membrane transporter [Bacteroidetes bacterium ADurb.Bin145]HOU02145.1 TonB-dependent receptor plug domain-containing protein [Bacteroidales bacterium]HQK67517.1 TonB-dependent receptor plug domain-containing protein [Bacteroidales bacterium]